MDTYQTDSSQNTTDDEDKIIPYYEANKTSISMQKKDYYKKNRTKILKKIKCECGRFITKNQLLRHKRSKIHQQYENFLKDCDKKLDNSINFD